MRTRSKIFTFAAALVGLLLIPTAAFAYAPTGDEFITCTAGGDADVECVAGPYDPNTEFSFEASYNPTIATGSGTVNADGEAEFSFDASDVPAGEDITVQVTGIRDGQTVVLADEVVEVAADGEIIANAGSDAALLALGAGGAIALGGAALFVSRRKRTTTAA